MKAKKISIVGLGYVGLPMAIILASLKDRQSNEIFSVYGIDNNIKKIKKKFLDYKLNKSTNIYEDPKLDRLFKIVLKRNKIKFTDNILELKNSSVIIVSINFDLKTKSIKGFDSLKNFFTKIGKNIDKKSLIVLETTVPPGTCKNIIIPTLKSVLKKRGLGIDDIYFSYSYERVMPGKEYYNSIVNNYRCYSGFNRASKKECENFLKNFINYKKYQLKEFETITECECAKILENTFRSVNIALIDEWTKFASEFNLNLNEIIKSIKMRKTHNNLMRPGLGVGGYCLTKDPGFINTSSKFFSSKKFNFPITNAALKINKLMPNTSIEMIKDTVKSMANKKILIMGVSYKKDVKDIRFSPSLYLYKYLKTRNAKVTLHDPLAYNSKDISILIEKKIPKFKNFNIVVFCVDHSCYKDIAFKKFSKKPFYFDLNSVLNLSQKKFLRKNNYKLKVLGDHP